MINLITPSEIWLLSPLIVLFLTSLIPLTIKVMRGNEEQPAMATLAQALAGILVAGFLIVYQWDNLKGLVFQRALVFDGLSSIFNLVTLIVTAVCLLYAYENTSIHRRQFSEMVFLVLNSVVGMFILTWANDLIVTFIGLELMSLALYVLVGMGHEQVRSKEASFKYFILGSFGSAIFLYGVALIYGASGTTMLSVLDGQAAQLVQTDRVFLLGIVFLMVGLLFKVSIFPFHAWAPDVYQGAPTPITALMATAVKMVMFAVLIRVTAIQGLLATPQFNQALQWLAVMTMFIGNLSALRQIQMKRMLAYSSIAHSGYVIVGLIAMSSSGSGVSSAAGIAFYLFIYSIMNLGAFGVLHLFERDENQIVLMDDFRGLAQRKPLLALAMTVFLLGLTGFPPTAGFFSKLYLFTSAVGEELYWLVVWAVLNSVISAYYYLRPIVLMYMQPADALTPMPLGQRLFTRGIILVSALLILILGIASQPLVEIVRRSVGSLFNI